jgi:hypothetical protein
MRITDELLRLTDSFALRLGVPFRKEGLKKDSREGAKTHRRGSRRRGFEDVFYFLPRIFLPIRLIAL